MHARELSAIYGCAPSRCQKFTPAADLRPIPCALKNRILCRRYAAMVLSNL
jgi:hypothetical protein